MTELGLFFKFTALHCPIIKNVSSFARSLCHSWATCFTRATLC